MRDDEKFNISFVKKIKSYKCLYDYTRTDYKTVHIQEKAWAEIAEELKDSVSSCKERWRNLRGCYTRHLKHKANLTSEKGRFRKPYYLATHLDFISPFTKTRGNMTVKTISTMNHSQASGASVTDNEKPENSISLTITNVKEDVDDPDFEHDQQTNVGKHESIQNQDETEEEWVTEQQDDENITIEQATQNTPGGPIIVTSKDDSMMLPSGSSHPLIFSNSMPCSTPLISSGSTSNQFISQLSRPIKPKIEDTNPQLQEFQIIQNSYDSDLYFLKSLLPDIQTMNLLQKRKLRIAFMNVIDSILSEGENET